MTENQPWGDTTLTVSPAPAGTKAKGGWSKMKMAIVAAVAGAVVVVGGVAVANASTTSSSTTSSSQQGPGGGMGAPGGGMGGGDGLQGALHGDFTVATSSGSYTTERLQSGTVTAVSSTSITAKSADGHTTTFVVGSSTKVDNGNDAISAVKTGDTVTVVGTVSGDTVTATTIMDTTLDSSGALPSAATS